MYTYSFPIKSKHKKNAFNHIQTMAEEKKIHTRRKERKDKEILATIIIGQSF